jgi:NAD(P)-dependent dehydrogenase (short-subunit alcohol dehydrogenase family)
MRSAAEAVVASLAESARPAQAIFIPVNILDWADMVSLFRSTKDKFGSIDVVVANAGVMESSLLLESPDVDENGEPKEPTEAYKVIDINLKGTFNSKSEFRVFRRKTLTFGSITPRSLPHGTE